EEPAAGPSWPLHQEPAGREQAHANHHESRPRPHVPGDGLLEHEPREQHQVDVMNTKNDDHGAESVLRQDHEPEQHPRAVEKESRHEVGIGGDSEDPSPRQHQPAPRRSQLQEHVRPVADHHARENEQRVAPHGSLVLLSGNTSILKYPYARYQRSASHRLLEGSLGSLGSTTLTMTTSSVPRSRVEVTCTWPLRSEVGTSKTLR